MTDSRTRQLALAWLTGLVLFVALGLAVTHGVGLALDQAGLRAFREPGAPQHLRGPDGLVEVTRAVSVLGTDAMAGPLIACGALALLVVRRFHEALWLTLAGASAMVLHAPVKHFFLRPRPHVVPWLAGVGGTSFPSGHAFLSSAVYLSLGAVAWTILHPLPAARRLALGAAILIVALVGATRVILGVHYPSDVLGGWLAGGLWALLVAVVVRIAGPRAAPAAPPSPAPPPASRPEPSARPPRG
jgi:undecaprenyl-diphosphatase